MNITPFFDRIFEIALKAWDKLPEILLIAVIGYIAIRVIKSLLHGAIRVSRANAAMKGLLISAADIGLWVLVIAIILNQIGLSQIALALSGSVVVVGLAVSVGSSTLIQDLFSGVFLAQDPDFHIGDTIEVNKLVGTVERMDARKVRIRDDKGQLHVISNSVLDKAGWILLNKRTQRGGK